MQIAADRVVTFDYTLKNDQGEVLDTSEDGPMVYLHGYEQIVPGLERALQGKDIGDNVKVRVAPAEGYGERSRMRPIRVPREDLPEGFDPEEGMCIGSTSDDGQEINLWVTQVGDDDVELSFDHPLAGETLHFDVTVVDVRSATREELSHGHAHGPDGHHHHEENA